MKKNKYKLIILLMIVFLFTGCTEPLRGKDKKPVVNEVTGQSLTKNIICQPTDEKTIELYEKNGVEIEKLQKCSSYSLKKGLKEYDGLWSTVFVKPLSWFILKIGRVVKSNGLSLIIVSILIRLIAFPITRKTAMQSELIAQAQPELDKLEKKYADKNDQDSMMKKSQEMAAIYKKYKINPVMGCLFAFIQLPLFIAFLEAINRVPAIFEEKFLLFELGITPATALSHGFYLYLIISILVAATTFFSMKLNSTANQNNQQVAMMNKIMFGMIVIMSFAMTTALNIYWVTTNVFTIVQNLLVKRKKD